MAARASGGLVKATGTITMWANRTGSEIYKRGDITFDGTKHYICQIAPGPGTGLSQPPSDASWAWFPLE